VPDPVFAIATEAIIAIVVVALILIALLVLLPKMRKQAAERKAEQQRRERERQLEHERREKAQEHRSEADQKRHQAELAEAEAQRARAEADINAKRAELHEGGLADHELPSGDAAVANGRVDGDFEPMGRGRDRGVDFDRDDDRGGGRGIRDLGGGGRAHEPEGDSAYERGLRDAQQGRGDDTGFRETGDGRPIRPEDHNEIDEGRPGPLR
jgi:hypothetical protein